MRKAFLLFMALVYSVSAQNNKLDITVEFLPAIVYEYCPLYAKLEITNNTADTIQLMELYNSLYDYGVFKGKKGEYEGTINVSQMETDLPPNEEITLVENLDYYGSKLPFGEKYGYFRPDEYEARFKVKNRIKSEGAPIRDDEITCKFEVLELEDSNVRDMLSDIAELHKPHANEQKCIKIDSLIDTYKTSPIIRRLYALAIFYSSKCITDKVSKLDRIKEYIKDHPEDGMSYYMLMKAHMLANNTGRWSKKIEIDGGEMQVDMYEIYSECTDAKLKKYIEKKFVHKKKTVE